MILPDVNVLIYAFRQDVPQHSVSRSWLASVVAGDAQFAISKMALSGLIRVTTNRRSYPSPSSLDKAFEFCDALLSQPHCQTVEPGERHWEIFRRLCVETGARGPDVTDVWYAALAIEWGCEWITFDRGFAKFSGLKYTLLSAPST